MTKAAAAGRREVARGIGGRAMVGKLHTLLLIPFRQDLSAHFLNHVMRGPAFESWIFQFVIHVPPICLKNDGNAIAGKISVSFFGITSGNPLR